MKILGRKGILVLLSLTATVALALGSDVGDKISASGTPVDGGLRTTTQAAPVADWSVAALPYTGPGYESRPVVVIGVISDMTTGFIVTKVSLKNISSKPVKAVKIGWALSSEQAKAGGPLLRGQTSLIPVNDRIPAEGGIRMLTHPVFILNEAAKPLIESGKLAGMHLVEVAVVEAVFEDDSSWNVEQKVAPARKLRGAQIIGASYRGRTVPLKITPLPPAPQTGCSRQACKYNSGPPAFWTCADADYAVSCMNCGPSCCSWLCNQPRTCGCGGQT